MPRHRPRPLVALLLALAACGPGAPDGGAGTSTGVASDSDAPITGDATTSTTTSPGDPLPATTTSAGTAPSTDGPDTTSDTTLDPGPCVADPVMGVCTDACDFYNDCCQCEGVTFVLDPRAPDCELAMGIVAAACPWHPYQLLADGVPLPGDCRGAGVGWDETEKDGDVWISLCDETCAQFMAGEIVELEARMFCEAA